MPSVTPTSTLTIRSHLPRVPVQTPAAEIASSRKLKHPPSTSYPDAENTSLSSLGFHPLRHQTHKIPSYDSRPAKRPMPTPHQTIAVVNSSGRQAASFIRVAVAVGYRVRAQLRSLDGIVASEIASLPNVTVIVGDLFHKPTPSSGSAPGHGSGGNAKGGVNHQLIADLFRGAQLAFINTTYWGDEEAIGRALADTAVKASIKHLVYSSMPDHSQLTPPSAPEPWPSLPLWSSKAAISAYIKSLPTLAPSTTFLYTGIYNNNFTSLPYPIFCTELQSDGSFVWEAPFHPHVKLPWLDAEHDVGPAVLQIFKDGVNRWAGQTIPLAYEMLSPTEACQAFSRGTGRRISYRRRRKIEVRVKIPTGYREQLVALEDMYRLGEEDPDLQPFYFGSKTLEDQCVEQSLGLWEGPRGLEEYAREVFPLEEAANGLTWMNEGTEGEEPGEDVDAADAEEEGSDDEGLEMGGGVTGTSTGTATGGENTPARKEESWLA